MTLTFTWIFNYIFTLKVTEKHVFISPNTVDRLVSYPCAAIKCIILLVSALIKSFYVKP